MRIISLGAGVQSTTLLLLANHGELPGGPVDYAIFADTGWEPKAVYEHLAWLERASEIPVLRVTAGNLRKDAMDHSTRRRAAMPLYVVAPRGRAGSAVMPRQCTREYKIDPIARRVRELLGARPRQRIPPGAVEMLLGLSLDEVQRMKPSDRPWLTITWPLIEKRMTRHDCELWLQRHGYPIPPKSACIGCPFHGNAYWREMRDERPDEWADAVDFDAGLRDGRVHLPRVEQPTYLHRSFLPLREVDLSTPADGGQGDLFGEECSGTCGV